MGVLTPERVRQPEPPPQQPPPPPRRDVPWGLIGLAVFVALVLAVPGWLTGLLPGIPNPFARETVDRSGPAVLQSIRDLAELRAASGHFEVVIDLEQDTGLPDELLGERVLFVAVGDVDASVDLRGLDSDAVDVSGKSVSLTLPPPRLSEPRLDLQRSYVYSRNRGILDEIGDLFRDERNVERNVYLLAEQKIARGAQRAGILPRAEENVRRTLGTLLRSLGFTSVTIRFRPEPV
jgi:Protein of unknown function (DUF4230)